MKWCHHGLIVKFVGNKDSKHFKKKYEVRKSVARDEIHARSLLTDRISEFDERDFGKLSTLLSITNLFFRRNCNPEEHRFRYDGDCWINEGRVWKDHRPRR